MVLLLSFAEAKEDKIFQKEIELMEKGFMLTPALLKEAVNDHVEAVNQKTILEVFNDFQAMRKPLIGKKIAKALPSRDRRRR